LVLDDEPSILKAVRRTLRQGGRTAVVTTLDPHEALEILRDRPPKVLITDFRMPEMNGVEVLRRAQRIAPETVRIMLTAQADRDNIVDAVNDGRIFRYVAKPWDNHALNRIVDEAAETHDAAHRQNQAFVEADRERRSLEAAVTIVGDIQRSMLPEAGLEVAGGHAACSFTPCEHATGDYVDAMALPGGRSALVIGDVSGHGLGAAVFVFTARALLRSGLAEGRELATVVARTNQFLCHDMADGRFLTLFLAIHDPAREVLTYVNAGHTPPLLLEPGGLRALKRTGLPLGILDDTPYDLVGEVPFRGPVTLFGYTDGLVEARDHRAELFGEERLAELLAGHTEATPSELVSRVRTAVHEFRGEKETQDDLTLLAYAPVARATEANG
jgi:sigma-B regulation protein RsbU (phosphoserine phosphatase)